MEPPAIPSPPARPLGSGGANRGMGGNGGIGGATGGTGGAAGGGGTSGSPDPASPAASKSGDDCRHQTRTGTSAMLQQQRMPMQIRWNHTVPDSLGNTPKPQLKQNESTPRPSTDPATAWMVAGSLA